MLPKRKSHVSTGFVPKSDLIFGPTRQADGYPIPFIATYLDSKFQDITSKNSPSSTAEELQNNVSFYINQMSPAYKKSNIEENPQDQFTG